MTPLVSALIVNWNTRDATLACLDALHASVVEDRLSCETIVVDNGSRDGSREALQTRAGIQLIANAENRGFAAAVNQAYVAARGEFVLLLNPDVTLNSGALEKLVLFLEQHPTVAGVGPAYLNPDGSPQQHHYRLPTFLALTAAVSLLKRLGPFRRAARRHRMLDEDFSQPCQIEQPSASCLLLRHAMLPPGPLLDEAFPIYFNDVVLARRLAQRRAALWMTPQAAVVHELGGSTRLLGDSLTRHHLASLIRYATYTQPRYRVIALKLLIRFEASAKRLLRRPTKLNRRDLVAAVHGDPGPLPQVNPADR